MRDGQKVSFLMGDDGWRRGDNEMTVKQIVPAMFCNNVPTTLALERSGVAWR